MACQNRSVRGRSNSPAPAEGDWELRVGLKPPYRVRLHHPDHPRGLSLSDTRVPAAVRERARAEADRTLAALVPGRR